MSYKKLEINSFEVKFDERDSHLFVGKTWRIYTYGVKKYLKWVSSTNNVQKIVSFHRLVINAASGEIVNHINGDSLDNRRENLRIVNPAQNARNQIKYKKTASRFKGVSFSKGKWRARIKVCGVLIGLGTFDDEVHAAYVYDIASMKHHMEYGRTNFLPLVM